MVKGGGSRCDEAKYCGIQLYDPFRLKSKQTPGPSNYTPLENLINRIKSTLSQIKPTIGRPNLPEDGMNLIKKLGNEQELIINTADKGSCIVLLDRQKYVDEGHKHLADPQTYTRLECVFVCVCVSAMYGSKHTMHEHKLYRKCHTL